LLGCNEKVQEVNLMELQQLVIGPKGRGSTMWRGTFYCGTAGKFHFISHKIKLHRDLLLKIKTNELHILSITNFPIEWSKWVEISSLIITNAPSGIGKSKIDAKY
jgi:hypothetical protein